jgi:mannitol/fructose-specific phosphotransferase system IIA component (Ntr-type)
MIDGFTLTKELVKFEQGFASWEDALVASAKGLLEGEYIQQSYVDAIVQSVKDYGPYIVIAPNIAMPHARPEAGAKKVGFSIMICEEPVSFGETEDLNARLFITLSCVDSDTHLKMMQALVEVLGNQEQVDALLSTKDVDTVLDIFK